MMEDQIPSSFARSASLRAGRRQSGKDLFFRFSARLKSGPDTCVAVETHCDQDAFGCRRITQQEEDRAFGVAAYGAPLLL